MQSKTVGFVPAVKDPKYIRKTEEGQWLMEIPAMGGDDCFYVGEYDTENGARWDRVKYCIQTVLQPMDVAQVCLYTLYILLIERNIFIVLFTIVDNCC